VIRNVPRISVITPSLNQACYLHATMRSVLDQGYADLEYIVIDGGSTDGSVEIIRGYAERLAYWVSERDGGQSAAINKGLMRATGDVLCYLNSDDVFQPGALEAVAQAYLRGGDWWSGGCVHFGDGRPDYEQMPVGAYSLGRLAKYSPLAQPSTFWSRQAFEKVGFFNPDMHYAFDFEYWLRLALAGFLPVVIPRLLAGFRHHDKAKTCTAGNFYKEENIMFARLGSDASLWQKAIFLRASRWRGMMASLEQNASRINLLKRYPEVLFSRGGGRYLAGR
jgi:glycosyltransferase involved in cell wall biosynthesis